MSARTGRRGNGSGRTHESIFRKKQRMVLHLEVNIDTGGEEARGGGEKMEHNCRR